MINISFLLKLKLSVSVSILDEFWIVLKVNSLHRPAEHAANWPSTNASDYSLICQYLETCWKSISIFIDGGIRV